MSITRAKKSTQYLLQTMAEVSQIPIEMILESYVMAHLGQDEEEHRQCLKRVHEAQTAPGYWRLKVAEAQEHVGREFIRTQQMAENTGCILFSPRVFRCNI